MSTVNQIRASHQTVSPQSSDTDKLYERWHGIRLQEIRRQLSIMSSENFFITTDVYIQSSKIIQIPNLALTLPIEVMACIAAFYWSEKMHSSVSQDSKPYSHHVAFVGLFLASHHYSLEKVIRFCLKSSNSEILEQFPFLKSSLVSFMLAYQNGQHTAQNIQRRNRYKAKSCSSPHA